MNFIDNWKRAWKFISIQCFALIAAGNGAVGVAAVFGIKSDIYETHGYIISTGTVLIAFFGVFGVLTQQDSLPDWLPIWKLKQSNQEIKQ